MHTRSLWTAWRSILAMLLGAAGLLSFAWILFQPRSFQTPAPLPVDRLQSGAVAAMTSPAFVYSPGWQVTAAGVDPAEPADPWREPAGVITFNYQGHSLDLLLALGDYWGYLYVTVDGLPANRLANIHGNLNSQGQLAGYRTFYAPELAHDGQATAQWVAVHHTSHPGPHSARVEVWRSWDQFPIRAAAIDALPPSSFPLWPGVAALLAALWLGAAPLYALVNRHLLRPLASRQPPLPRVPFALPAALAGAAMLSLIIAVAANSFLLGWLGLLLLGFVSLWRPLYWVAALLFALPFYFNFALPLLPNRAVGILEVGLLGGAALALVQTIRRPISSAPVDKLYQLWWMALLALTSWALVAAVAATYPALALREWRTLFLAAPLFLWLLHTTLVMERHPQARWLLVAAWLAGGVLVATVGLWQYLSGEMVIEAEGVRRVRGFYGSPNNLALYLERPLMVSLALACFLPYRRAQWLAGTAAMLMGTTLLLTFSKGSLLLAIPAGLVALWLGGWKLLPAQLTQRRALGWVALAALLAVAAILPFIGAERFQRLLDLTQGTGFLRLQLWRSAWHMALDHLWLGVGPDQFLYHFRSIYLLPAAWQEPNLNHPHNLFLDLPTRLGLPGLLFGLLFFTTGLLLQWRLLHTPDPVQAVLALGLLASTAAALAHGLIDASYALPDLMLVWVFLFGITAKFWQSPQPV